MAKIFQLEQHVADLIAAGEVVERPASVVKELMENSIDAGARAITVEINAGGMSFIRVTDDGCGIAPEDAGTAFLRHATSKLRDAQGLEAIGTLGFRGEALAAIAAVSRIEMITRERGASEGVSLAVEAGEVLDVSPAGAPEGTTIVVRDLFFNTPARMKFMKSDRAEGSGVASAVMRCALSRPDVSVRFIKDGRIVSHTPGDSRIDSCVYSLFGREFSEGLMRAETSDDAVSVEGLVSSKNAARGNRSYQFFFVNGRSIRSKTLQAALEQAYANTLPSGKYPACAIYITIKPSSVDVNVHPAKVEVKFVSDKQVFDGVYYAALGAINNSEFRVQNSESGLSPVALPQIAEQRQDENLKSAECTGSRAFPASGLWRENSNGGSRTISTGELFNTYSSAPPAQRDNSETQDSRLATQIPAIAAPFRVIGEAMNTYILVEYMSSVLFIDKHAAHERIHFDAMKAAGFEPMSQALLNPVICRQGYEDASYVLENAAMLDRLGFEVESFGEDAVAIRRIPAEIEISDAESVLSEICGELKRGGIAEPARRDGILRAVACKAAIKSGQTSAPGELGALAARVLSGEITHCPHGRPLVYEMSKAALDRSFKRT